MKSIILVSILLFSTMAIATDSSVGNWYDPGEFKPTKVEWLQTPDQECNWWHEWHSYGE